MTAKKTKPAARMIGDAAQTLGSFVVCVIRQGHTFDGKKICSVCGAKEGSPTLIDILAEEVAKKLAERSAKKESPK